MAHATKVTDAEVQKRLAAIEYGQGSLADLAPDRRLADELTRQRVQWVLRRGRVS